MTDQSPPNPVDITTMHLSIAGRVQGVWYRVSMQQTAQQLRLGGWCRNCPDGRVEGVAQGPLAMVEQLVTWCHQGPPMADVTEVNTTPLPHDNALPFPFEVRP